ncbi:hypothetical protein [Zavarzinella formosa]|uniref:hypothetical protein n=1 Tax=Zavarzinella formosa TaxID=360055 RepID=UPI0002FF9D3E|nr:hypothetical protein [Zavarzinella formosa]
MGNSTPTLQLPPVVNPAKQPEDTLVNDSFELALMTLLANLEYLRQEMEHNSEQHQPTKALAKAEEMLEDLVKFADEQKLPQISASIREATAQVGRFYEILAPVRDQFQEGGFRKFFGLGGLGRKLPKTDGRQEQYARCLESVNEATLQYFIAFTEHFSCSKAARPWVETAAGFLADLKRVIRDIKV